MDKDIHRHNVSFRFIHISFFVALLFFGLSCGPSGEEGVSPQTASRGGIGIDSDQDGIPNITDVCPNLPNPTTQIDTDKDGVGDDCDNCPNTSNPTQADSDKDGKGDACSGQTGGGGSGGSGGGSGGGKADSDGDGFSDDVDNCPSVKNAKQQDLDGDKVGDACDSCTKNSVVAQHTIIVKTPFFSSGNSVTKFLCAVDPNAKVTLSINNSKQLQQSPCDWRGLNGETWFENVGPIFNYGQGNVISALVGANGGALEIIVKTHPSSTLEGKVAPPFPDEKVTRSAQDVANGGATTGPIMIRECYDH